LRPPWYSKAEARGVKPGSIESEIRSLLGRMLPEKTESVIGQLLSIDPVQYVWLRKKSTGNAIKAVGLGASCAYARVASGWPKHPK